MSGLKLSGIRTVLKRFVKEHHHQCEGDNMRNSNDRTMDPTTGEIHSTTKVLIRTPYNYNVKLASLNTGLRCTDPSKTQQDQKDETDINLILKRYAQTGVLPPSMTNRMPTYEHFDEVFDFQSAQNIIREAQNAFMDLPSKLRDRFQNDPQKYLEFCTNPENQEEIYKLGLAERPKPDTIPPKQEPTPNDTANTTTK